MNKFIILSAGLLVTAGFTHAAETVRWAATSPSDIRIERLPDRAPASPPSRHAEARPVRFAWPLEVDEDASAAAGPAMESRQYWVDTTGRGLERGLKLPLSAPGGLIRISALHAGTGLMLESDRLNVEIDGRTLPLTQSADGIRVVSGERLRAKGMPVPEDTLAFELPDSAPPGTLRLSLAGAPADQPLVVHVFEPRSPWHGRLTAERHHYLAGESIELDVALRKGESLTAAESVQAVLVGPDAARAWPLEVTDDGFGLRGVVPEDLPKAGPGLYEVHAYLQARQADTVIRRDLKLALNVAAPTARLTGLVEAVDSDGLVIEVGVEAAASGRYQLSGQVWGSNASGELEPLAMAQSAVVLEAGEGRIALEVPVDLLDESGLSAPFRVRELELLDQGRMALLESRSAGLIIAASKRPAPADERSRR
jgi:hypothetical protein